MLRQIGTLIGTAIVVAGCAAPPLPVVDIRKTWADALAPYGMTPIYPMREDFFVGDVYLSANATCEGEVSAPSANNSWFLATMEVNDSLKDHYEKRPSFPATHSLRSLTVEEKTEDGTKKISINSNEGSTEVEIYPDSGGNRPVTRGRLAAFPAFELGTFSVAQLGLAGVGGGGLGRLFGALNQESKNLKVTLNMVEETNIPLFTLYDKSQDFLDKNICNDLKRFEGMIDSIKNRQSENSQSCLGQSPSLKSNASLTYVSRVFYARQISFEFDWGDAQSLALAAALAKPEDLAQRPQLPDTNNLSQGESGDNQTLALARALNALLESQTPGFRFGLTISESGRVALTQVFDRPLAFATDAVLSRSLDENYIKTIKDRCAKINAGASAPGGQPKEPPAKDPVGSESGGVNPIGPGNGPETLQTIKPRSETE